MFIHRKKPKKENKRLTMRRQKYKGRKQNESAESREERLTKLPEKCKNQSMEAREIRLSGKRQRAKQAINNKSGESR